MGIKINSYEYHLNQNPDLRLCKAISRMKKHLPTTTCDLVIINRQEKLFSLLELTCSFERNAGAANLRKTLRYTALKSDLEDRGFRCLLVSFEVGSRGHVRKASKSNVLNIFLTFNISASPF